MDKKIFNKEDPKACGIHVLNVCDATSGRAKTLEWLIEKVIKERQEILKFGKDLDKKLHDNWMKYHWFITQLNRRFLVRQYVVKNVTTTVGRSVLCQRLSGTTTYTGVVNYGALGTDATAAAEAQTTLGAEVYRKALSSGTYLNATAYLENFYNATETNGTYEEFSFVIDGGVGVDTGQMFNRFTQTVVKSNTETLNVRSEIQISDT
jgi:hypothetical protein